MPFSDLKLIIEGDYSRAGAPVQCIHISIKSELKASPLRQRLLLLFCHSALEHSYYQETQVALKQPGLPNRFIRGRAKLLWFFGISFQTSHDQLFTVSR